MLHPFKIFHPVGVLQTVRVAQYKDMDQKQIQSYPVLDYATPEDSESDIYSEEEEEEEEEDEIDLDHIHFHQYQNVTDTSVIEYINAILIVLLKGFLFSSTFTFPIIVALSGFRLNPSTVYYYIEWILLSIAVKYGPIKDGALMTKYYVLILGVVLGIPLELTYISFSIWFLLKLFGSVVSSFRSLIRA